MLKCVPRVQHDYFSSFNQSNHCFLALSLPLPPSLLKLSNWFTTENNVIDQLKVFFMNYKSYGLF